MKPLLLILSLLFFSCKGTSQKVKTEEKEYTYKYQNNTSKTDDISDFFGRVDYQLENFISPITRDEFLKDSIQYKNEYTFSDNLLENSNVLKLPYGKVKFIKNLKRDSDGYINYNYIGFSKLMNSHIINISLYEGNKTLLLNNAKYDYKVIDNEPVFSKNKILTYTDSEGLSSFLILYSLKNNSLKFDKLLWSETNIIDYAIWNNNDEVILNLRNIGNNKVSYYKLSNNLKKISVDELMQKNTSTPEKVIYNLVFTRDKNDTLQINTKILDYISKTTTRENSSYMIALENYINKDGYNEYWNSQESSKIEAYIFNTTYPLRKKYWTDKFDECYGGKP